MRLRINDPELIPELLEYLESSSDAIAVRVAEDEVEVSLVGSYALEALRMELYLRIRAWESARTSRRASVELVD